MLYPAMKRWLPALAAALLACLILDGGFFLTIPVLGSPGLPGIFLWIAVLTVLFAVSWPGVPAKDAFLFSGFGALYALMTLLGLRYSRNEAIYQSAADFLVPLAALTPRRWRFSCAFLALFKMSPATGPAAREAASARRSGAGVSGWRLPGACICRSFWPCIPASIHTMPRRRSASFSA